MIESEINGMYLDVFISVFFLFFILESSGSFKAQILTPVDSEQRGAQLSICVIGVDARQLFNELERLGVCVSFSLFRIINYFCLLFF